MTTPIQRISRLLDEGARFMVQLPGQTSIDLTPDIIAAMDDAIKQGVSAAITVDVNRADEK